MVGGVLRQDLQNVSMFNDLIVVSETEDFNASVVLVAGQLLEQCSTT
jgi:hypothetical protein